MLADSYQDDEVGDSEFAGNKEHTSSEEVMVSFPVKKRPALLISLILGTANGRILRAVLITCLCRRPTHGPYGVSSALSQVPLNFPSLVFTLISSFDFNQACTMTTLIWAVDCYMLLDYGRPISNMNLKLGICIPFSRISF